MKNFWYVLTMASLVWYTTVTLYVAWKGLLDIRSMLRRLKTGAETSPTSPQKPGVP